MALARAPLLFAAAFVACLAAGTPASADRFSLTYEGAALGVVPIGGVTLDADVSEDSYEIQARLRSGGIAALFEHTDLSASASGAIAPGGIRWRAYDLDHRYSKKRRRIAMRVGPDGQVLREISPNYRLWGDPPTSDSQIQGARDPLSTLMAMAIDIGESRRCAGAYPTFDGRFFYLLELAGGKIDRFEGGGYEGEALSCSMAYVAVAGYERQDRGRRRIPHGEIWFALPERSRFAPPVRIATPLAAGGAVIRLTEWRRVEISVVDDASVSAPVTATAP